MTGLWRVRWGQMVVLVAVLVADQISKQWALEALGDGSRMVLWPILSFQLSWNTGIGFGLLREWSSVWVLVSLTGAVVIGVLIWWWREPSAWRQYCLMAMVSGALGNVIDRVRYGGVVDFVDAHWGNHHWPTFNVADMAISMSVGLLILGSLISDRGAPGSFRKDSEAPKGQEEK